MRGSKPLIVILPAVPTALGDMKGGRTPDRFWLRTIRKMLVPLTLGIALVLGLDWALR
ncbi:hypothetical protein ACKVEX_08420 [Rhodocyclaceae bacterium SMB388]